MAEEVKQGVQTNGVVATDTTTVTDEETKVKDNLETIDSTNTEVKDKTEQEIDKDKEIMIPKERFDEVNNKYKELSQQFEEIQGLKEQLETQLGSLKQEKDGTQTAVTETAEKLEAQAKQYETLLNSVYQDKLKIVPEEMQELIPEGLSTEDRISWINKAEEKGLFQKEEKPKVVVGQPLNHSAEQEQAEKYKKMNPLQLMASYYGIGK